MFFFQLNNLLFCLFFLSALSGVLFPKLVHAKQSLPLRNPLKSFCIQLLLPTFLLLIEIQIICFILVPVGNLCNL